MLFLEGLLHTDDIVKLVFSEVGLVKQTGPLKWIFDELKQLQEIKFRFKVYYPVSMVFIPNVCLNVIFVSNILIMNLNFCCLSISNIF